MPNEHRRQLVLFMSMKPFRSRPVEQRSVLRSAVKGTDLIVARNSREKHWAGERILRARFEKRAHLLCAVSSKSQ